MQSKAEALNEWKKKFYASPSQKIFDTCYNFISFGADYNEEMDEERMSQIETIVDTGLEEMNEAACYQSGVFGFGIVSNILNHMYPRVFPGNYKKGIFSLLFLTGRDMKGIVEGFLERMKKGEVPVVPEYDYTEVVATITSLDEKIAIIKHALNVTNSNEKVQVGDAEMSIDTILIKMAQLNKRKSVLDQMRKQLPKAREEQRSYMSRNTVPEYRYINYDLELIKKEYEAVSKTIMEMQMALDKYNQTVQFEVDI